MFNWWENDITFKLHKTLIARRLGQNLVMVDSPWNNGLQFGMVNDLEIFFWNLKRKEKWFFFIIEALKISYSTLSKSIQIQEEFTGVSK